jgi:hypothetical protein
MSGLGDINGHGLRRRPPAAVAREVRQRSRFGCVICRAAVCQYEHIQPEFSDAVAHDPSRICLLCGHCHDKVTRGLLSKSTIKRRYAAIQSSEDVHPPLDEFDLSEEVTVVLGSCIFHKPKALLEIDGVTALAIEGPEDGAAFPTLSGAFADDSGNELLRIDRNIWSGASTAWDVEVKGPTITVRPSPRRIGLRMRVEPPDKITVEKLDMRVGQCHLLLDTNDLSVGRIMRDSEFYVDIERLECDGVGVAIQVDTRQEPSLSPGELSIIGGEGISIAGTGIRLGVESGAFWLKGLHLEHATRLATSHFWVPLKEDS